MLQRSFLPTTQRIVDARRSPAACGQTWPSVRWVLIAVAASLFAACSSLQTGGASFGDRQYSLVAPAAAFAGSPSFADRVASNSLAESPLYARNIAIGDSTLAATIIHMRKLSPAFDSAMTAIEQSGIPLVIGTARQLRRELPPGYAQVSGWQALTAFYPLTRTGAPGRRIEHIAVIVRLSGLQSALRTAGSTADDSAMFNRYLERVLAHEIYGHAMPQIASGETAPIACDDPTGAGDWYSACVMQRERHVEAQISKARRASAALGTR